MISSTKIFEFESAHFLPGYEGNCKDLHGHSYKLEVTVTARELDPMGMIMDFKKLKEIVKPIVDLYDHKILNNVSVPMPTAENLVKRLVDQIQIYLPTGILIKRVKLWETSTSFVEWEDK